MAKKRYINTKFWSDDFIIELKPLERYFFLYLLTNEHTDICGIYELSLKVITRETDLDDKTIFKIFSLLKTKIAYTDGWVYIKNFEKHQAVNPKVQEGMKRSKMLVPQNILAKLTENDIDYNRLSKPTIETELPTLSLTPTLTPKPLYSCSSVMSDSDFDTFWTTYPKKKGKDVVKKKFVKLSKELLPKILESVEKEKKSEQWQKDKGQFIPFPLTWINQKRWEDETEIAEESKDISERRIL